jgi:hypothetical protein
LDSANVFPEAKEANRCERLAGRHRMKRRVAQLPLHTGKAPPWLFQRMTKLAGAVTTAIVEEFGPDEMLRRLSDPWWFQAFGCVLGFDWHSSGVTTVTCGALKEASKGRGADMGIVVAGGKGAASRNTPAEIDAAADRLAVADGERLVYASRMSAKVDSAAVQDGFQVYHHCFFFVPGGSWCVVQQGMDEQNGWARRYHWLGEHVADFVCEPHAAIRDLCDAERAAPGPQAEGTAPLEPAPTTSPASGKRAPRQLLLNMVAAEAGDNRRASAQLVREDPAWLLGEVERLTEGPTLFAPRQHYVLQTDVNMPRLRKIVTAAHEQHPHDFETLLGLSGVGPATVRSLSLLAEIIFQAPPSHRDPAAKPPTEGEPQDSAGSPRQWADYSYAHGGKDGTPFPVDRETYDRSIHVLNEAIRRARVGENDKIHALRRLADLGSPRK